MHRHNKTVKQTQPQIATNKIRNELKQQNQTTAQHTQNKQNASFFIELDIGNHRFTSFETLQRKNDQNEIEKNVAYVLYGIGVFADVLFFQHNYIEDCV